MVPPSLYGYHPERSRGDSQSESPAQSRDPASCCAHKMSVTNVLTSLGMTVRRWPDQKRYIMVNSRNEVTDRWLFCVAVNTGSVEVKVS
jgi:hypothetical protein